MDTVKVVVCGVGAMGSLMVRLLEDRPAVVVGAVDRDPDKAGRDLGEVAGLGRRTSVIVAPNAAGVLDRVECDVVLLATTAFAAEAETQILEALRRRRHVVSIVQELFFPVGAAVECAARIGERQHIARPDPRDDRREPDAPPRTVRPLRCQRLHDPPP